MLKCTHLNILNSTHVFPMTNVLTCLPASGGGSVVHHAFVKECDASIVNALDWLIVTELKPQALILAHYNQKLTH